jgi:OmpA-OmpF porin, OOP family
MKQIFIFVILFLSFFCSAQENLIPNPGFEEGSALIPELSIDADYFNKSTNDWYSPTAGSPDIFSEKSKLNDLYKSQTTYRFRIFEGGKMLGLILYYPESDQDFREYGQVKLVKPLIKGKNYELSFYVKLAPNSDLTINNIGVLFTDNPFNEMENKGVIKKKPQFNYEDLIDEKEWEKISFQFNAKEESSYITIGNFFDSKKMSFESVKMGIKGGEKNLAYVYFDDFNLKRIPLSEVDMEDPLLEVEDFIDQGKISFGYDSSKIEDTFISELDLISEFLTLHEEKKLVIRTFTNKLGQRQYNIRLATLRADSLKKYFLEKGIDESRIECDGLGIRPKPSVQFEIK